MARRSGFHPRAQRSSGVSRDWEEGTGGSAVLSITGPGASLLGSGVNPMGGELTVLRTRGIFDIFLTSATSAGDGFFGAVGIGIGSLQAFNAGAVSLPSALDEALSNIWLWHSYFSIHAGEAGGLSGGPEAHQRIMIDSKAMRKIDANQVMYASIDRVEIGTAVASVFLDSRVLVQDSGR